MGPYSMACKQWPLGRIVSICSLPLKFIPRLTIQDFNNPTGARMGLFTAIQNIGGFCSLFFGTYSRGSGCQQANGVVASYAADLLGRKGGVLLGLLVLFVGTIIQVVPSVNSGMYIAGRFLVGLGFVCSLLR
jgi:MFS family permease